jgi:hypothetical protein
VNDENVLHDEWACWSAHPKKQGFAIPVFTSQVVTIQGIQIPAPYAFPTISIRHTGKMGKIHMPSLPSWLPHKKFCHCNKWNKECRKTGKNPSSLLCLPT